MFETWIFLGVFTALTIGLITAVVWGQVEKRKMAASKKANITHHKKKRKH